MAHRVAFNDSILTLANHAPGIIDLTQSLPTYCKDKQETVYIQQAPGIDVYLCGDQVPLNKVMDREHPLIDQKKLVTELLLAPKDLGGVALTYRERQAVANH